MNPASVLLVIGIAQSIFLALIVVFLFVNRSRQHRRSTRRVETDQLVAGPLQRWLVGEADCAELATVLETLRPDDAVNQLVAMATSRVPTAQLAELCAEIRDASWVSKVLDRHRSSRWWRRLQAARLLSVVGGPRHVGILRILLADPHPAVEGAAAASLPGVADLDAVTYVLEHLPRKPLVVRMYQFSMLKEAWSYTIPALLERLTMDGPPASLEVWIALAEAMGNPDLLERVSKLHAHADPEVRIAVARGLKTYYHPQGWAVLLQMLTDRDWRVRGQAVRSLGALGNEGHVPAIQKAMNDPQWWVRFRAGLALAQMGDAGRTALRDARSSSDRYTAEMAAMIGGLSPGSIVELSDA